MMMREDDIRPAALLDQFFALLQQDAERLARRRAEFIPVDCPCCGADASELAFGKEGFDYRLCSVCESLYASPRPAPAALMEYAANAEAVKFWSTHFYRQTAEARREKIFRPRAALAAGLAAKGAIDRPQTFVDIGAGYGLYLQEVDALNLFARVVGVEPDARLAAICREQGFEVIEKWVEDIAVGEIAADFAAAFEVIEHVFDPCVFLAACGRALRPGGILLFTTLTATGFDLQVLWRRSRSISPPQHLNFPSISGVKTLIERSGLEVIEISTPGQLDVDIVRNMITAHPDLEVPRFARAIAMADDDTRRDFQAFLQNHRLSSHLRCVVRKPA